jgi:hypothetical protein
MSLDAAQRMIRRYARLVRIPVMVTGVSDLS